MSPRRAKPARMESADSDGPHIRHLVDGAEYARRGWPPPRFLPAPPSAGARRLL